MTKNSVDTESGSMIKYNTSEGKRNICGRVNSRVRTWLLINGYSRSRNFQRGGGPRSKGQDGLVDLLFEALQGEVSALFAEFGLTAFSNEKAELKGKKGS